MTKLRDLSGLSRCANACITYISYLGKSLWPFDLAVFYPHPAIISHNDLTAFWIESSLAAMLLVAITVGVVRLLRQTPYLLVGWFWYLGTLLPMIGLVQVGVQGMADRYTYIPLIGIYILIAWGLRDCLRRYPRFVKLAVPLSAVVLIGCTAISWFQIGRWRNSETLFRHALSVTNKNYFMLNCLGQVYASQEDYELAEKHYLESLSIKPNHYYSHHNLGVLYAVRKQPSRAIHHFKRSLDIFPHFSEAHGNLGVAYMQLGQLDEAERHLLTAVEIDSNRPMNHQNLGVVYQKQSRFDEAIACQRRALGLDPSLAAAHRNLGIAFASQNQFNLAYDSLRTAIDGGADDADTYNALGVVLGRQGEFERAATKLKKAIEIDPQHAAARENLEWVQSSAESLITP